jgi:hypothetical protein
MEGDSSEVPDDPVGPGQDVHVGRDAEGAARDLRNGALHVGERLDRVKAADPGPLPSRRFEDVEASDAAGVHHLRAGPEAPRSRHGRAHVSMASSLVVMRTQPALRAASTKSVVAVPPV